MKTKRKQEKRNTREKRKIGRRKKKSLLRRQRKERRRSQLIRRRWKKVSDKLRLMLLLKSNLLLKIMTLETTQCSELLSKSLSFRSSAIENLPLQQKKKQKLTKLLKNPRILKRTNLNKNSRKEQLWLLQLKSRRWLSSQLPYLKVLKASRRSKRKTNRRIKTREHSISQLLRNLEL